MNSERSKHSFLGRIVLVAAAVAMVGEGWLSLRPQPGPVVTYASASHVAASDAAGDREGTQPRECDPASGASSSCIFE